MSQTQARTDRSRHARVERTIAEIARSVDLQSFGEVAHSGDGRWLTDVWAPLEGRSFNGGVRWNF